MSYKGRGGHEISARDDGTDAPIEGLNPVGNTKSTEVAAVERRKHGVREYSAYQGLGRGKGHARFCRKNCRRTP
jgi:hypothetical protein